MKLSICAYSARFILFVFLSIIFITPAANAEEETHLIIPLIAYGATFYFDDEEGRPQFYKSLLASVVITHGLKAVVDKERPDDSGDDSFPSGHASGAFMGAAFLHKRYGWKYAWPAYIGAAYVGHRRVEKDKHDSEDVIAGAAIGILSSFYFTTSYKGVEIQPYAEGDSYGIALRTAW